MAKARGNGGGELRWKLDPDERRRLYEEGRYGSREVVGALFSRPSLIPGTVRTALRGATYGVRDDPELGWYLASRRMKRHIPDAATGAIWYGDESFVAALRPHLNSSTRALEVGCGSGRVLRNVAPMVKELVGCDLSKPMLEEAERNLSGLDNLVLVHASSPDLDQLDLGSFDVVYAHDVFVTIDPDPAIAMLDAMRRVLNPGGVCAASFLTIDEDAWAEEQMRLIRGVGSGGHFGVGHPRPYVSSQVDAMFRMAGFELIDSTLGEPGTDGLGRPHYIVVGKAPAELSGSS